MPAVPLAVAELDTTGAAGFIVMVTVLFPVPPALVALTVAV